MTTPGTAALTDQEHGALRESLGVYAIGKADAGERRTIREHLNRCPDCRHELAELVAAVGLLHQIRHAAHRTTD